VVKVGVGNGGGDWGLGVGDCRFPIAVAFNDSYFPQSEIENRHSAIGKSEIANRKSAIPNPLSPTPNSCPPRYARIHLKRLQNVIRRTCPLCRRTSLLAQNKRFLAIWSNASEKNIPNPLTAPTNFLWGRCAEYAPSGCRWSPRGVPRRLAAGDLRHRLADSQAKAL
jgi:hypothetical protein